MKRWKKAALCLILCLTATTAALAIWQKENLKALYTSVTKDAATLEQEMADKQQEQQNKLEEQYQVTVKPPSAQHNNDLINGVVTPEDVKGELGITEKLEGDDPAGTGKPVQPEEKPVQPKPEEKPEQPKPEEPKPEDSPAQPEMTEEERIAKINDLVDRCTAELYACEVDLMAQMGEMKKVALQDWNSRTPDGRTKDKMIEFGFAWLDEVYDVEIEADRTVKGILEIYKTSMEELDADTSVLDDMWLYYCNEKISMKAYYMNKYLD